MRDLSIFAKRRFFALEDGHLMRGSSVIRGEQVAEYTGARLNPESGYEKDVCIYVKPPINSLLAGHIKFSKHAYIDVIDGERLVGYASKNPQISVIACSQADYEYLSSSLNNSVVFIPQHHCNFDRAKRIRDRVTTVGIIGFPKSLTWLPENFEKKLNQIGLDLIAYSGFRQRRDVVDFYKKIDVQVIWRPWRQALQNPLKMVNAAAFGIPTIALEEDAFKELAGHYFPVKTLDEFLTRAQALKSSPDLYNAYAEKCFSKAEEYHISNVAQLYKKLVTA